VEIVKTKIRGLFVAFLWLR